MPLGHRFLSPFQRGQQGKETQQDGGFSYRGDRLLQLPLGGSGGIKKKSSMEGAGQKKPTGNASVAAPGNEHMAIVGAGEGEGGSPRQKGGASGGGSVSGQGQKGFLGKHACKELCQGSEVGEGFLGKKIHRM